MTQDNGASLRDRATAAEPVPVSALRDGIASAGLHILQHSLGLDQYGQGTFYRNHFVTGEGSIDHPICMELYRAGLMIMHPPSAITGEMDLFRVSDAGKQFVADHSPKPPKLTRAQQNYRRWLKAQAMETRRAETEGLGAKHDSAVPNGDAP